MKHLPTRLGCFSQITSGCRNEDREKCFEPRGRKVGPPPNQRCHPIAVNQTLIAFSIFVPILSGLTGCSEAEQPAPVQAQTPEWTPASYFAEQAQREQRRLNSAMSESAATDNSLLDMIFATQSGIDPNQLQGAERQQYEAEREAVRRRIYVENNLHNP